jgi:hemerythrin-like domain-containing protein
MNRVMNDVLESQARMADQTDAHARAGGSPLGADRRGFLRLAAAAAATSAAGLGLAACATGGGAHRQGAVARSREADEQEAEVTPGEDLMQEHGVLERIALIYDEAAGRLDRGEPLDLALVSGAAGIVRRFVEDYHERQEERSVFPRLEKARRETALVAVLLRQHQRGRELTDDILRRTGAGAGAGGGRELADLLRRFTRMYRPHAAREDTVLFPAFRAIVGRAGYRELGEQFEEHEHEQFGDHGFEDTVAEVARLESALGLDDLARFTP